MTDPDGYEWTVGPRWKSSRGLRMKSPWRDWLDRRRERRLKERRRGLKVRNAGKDGSESGGGGWDLFGIDDPIGLFIVVLVAGILVLFFVVWPLFAVAVELVVAIALLLAGVLGRLMFGKPWTVEARRDDGELQTWQTRGYGEMRATVRLIADDLAAGSEPRGPDALTA